MESICQAMEAQAEKLYKEKKFKEVEDMFSTLLKESEGEADTIKAREYNNRGHAKYMQVEFEEALKDYDQALKLDPSLTVAKYNRGTILYRLSKFEQARDDLKAAVEVEGDNQDYQEALQKCQAELK
jgi:tetratricopeptide (TPR) repeat protein